MVGWKTILHRTKSPRPSSTNSKCISNLTLENYDNFVAPAASASAVVIEENKINIEPEPEPEPDQDNDILPDDVQAYYYPNMDKDSATEALQERPIGTFLLRRSQCQNAKFTLSVRSDKHVFNVRIFNRQQQPDGGYHLDAPRRLRKYFPSIPDLLRYYSQAPRELVALCVSDGADERTTFKLMFPLSRSDGALNLAGANAGADEIPQRPPRLVARQTNGGSMKAMVNWL